MKERAALYIHSAISHAGQYNVLDAQESALRDYCERQGKSGVAVYIDSGKCKTGARPSLSALLEAARADDRDFDVVLVQNISRLSRNLSRVMAIVQELDGLGIRIVAMEGPNP